ncbi:MULTISPECIES: PIG-L family deacetylase [unclassified Photorhabdus]|uniref:PIG-L family deacetylase n=1 Tax=unclassified Photorhabdus TaxID=2620880 RepID=UPI000DCC8376|nr:MULTISPECIES: PIG-L family deacetylase [unclassified Photorhabdus]RAW94328.1 PIG-L family deacetylase [Photorhabdus sp. S9-53]RAW94480.1 PIG-L family deacetylase [Photorhabdus sp. S10-54]RAW98362.1 PIG-L family deacetylase [Photorhabdus sp. S8-52]
MIHLFLSPHLDDVALSAGGLIHKLVSENQKVVILTFFTEYDENITSHYSHSAHNDNMYSFIKLYSKRVNEDIAFCNKLSAIPIHGKILDCIYRTDQYGEPMYKNSAMIYSGQIHKSDDASDMAQDLIDKTLLNYQPDYIYAPLGIGRHVDHIIINNLVNNIKGSHKLKILLYEDFPYVLGEYPVINPDSLENALLRNNKFDKHAILVDIDLKEKVQNILFYESQLEPLFDNKSNILISLEKYHRTINEIKAQERFWLIK